MTPWLPISLLKTARGLAGFAGAACLVLALSPLESRAEDAASSFLKAYSEFQNGERLEQSADYERALAKYRFAASLLGQISRSDPEWQPMVVQYRLRKITEAIARVEGLPTTAPPPSSDGIDFPEGDLPTADPPQPRPPFPTTPRSLETRPAPTPPPSRSPSADTDSSRLRNENQQLRDELARRTAELKSARHEVDKTLVTVVELRHELMQAKTKLQDALKDSTSATKLREDFARQLKEISNEIEKTRAERDVLAEENEQLMAKLDQAAQYISASDAIRGMLEQERETYVGHADGLRAERDKVQDELEVALGELKTSRERLGEIDILTKENQALNEALANSTRQLEELDARLRASSLAEIESLKEAHANEISRREERIRSLEAENQQAREQIASSSAAAPELTAKIEEATTRIKELEEANKLTGELRQKLADAEKRLAEGEPEDVAALRLKLEEAEKQLADSSGKDSEELRKKLADAEKRLADSEAKMPVNDEAILNLQSELNLVNDRLFTLRNELSGRDSRIADLEKQLDDTAGELARMRLDATPTAESKEILVENELLREILLRQLKEQARRDQARRLVEEEIAKLELHSSTLKDNLAILASPIEFSEEERALFRLPIALVTDSSSPDSMEASIAITKPAAPPDGSAPPATTKKPEDFNDLPEELQRAANSAQQKFEEGDLASAEETFANIVQERPDNFYALAQLAATQFQLGKFKAAEVALDRVMSLNPEDAFANSILGVVYFRQNRLDEAEAALRKAVGLDPKKARTYNYLGIVVSQKGKFGEAEDYLQKALELDPNYAEAHFNLAVIYITQDPPSKELAKQHYQSALTLGAEPDNSLERLIY